MSELRTDFKDEILQEGETHRVYNIKRKGTDEVVESEVYLEKAYEALQEGDEFGAKDVNEIHVRLNNLVNDNLLINSDFRNPINQRGQTSYASVDGSYTCVYSIDRWRLQLGCCLTLNDDSINLTSNRASGTCAFQYVPEFVYEENNYTIQVNVKSLTNNANLTIYGTGAKVVLQKALSVGNNVFSIENSDIMLVQFDITKDTVLEIEYIKLERGSIATPFVPRQYGEELALCEQYYRKILGWHNSYPLRGDGNGVYLNLPFTMRTTPTINETGLSYAGIGSSVQLAQTISSVKAIYQRRNLIEVQFEKGANNTVNYGVGILTKDTELDAEIY